MSMLADNLARIHTRIAEAAARAGREPGAVKLVAVTKTIPAARVAELYALGVRDFGENRVEEGRPKQAGVPAGACWHMIGHVQSRKAAEVAAHFALVHSLDSLKLARRLGRAGLALGRPVEALVEVNVAGEAAKYGYRLSATLEDDLGALLAVPGLAIRGLMTMAPWTEDAETARPVFAGLRALRARLQARYPEANWAELSMGMSDDFEVAVEEGATLVRVGRALFAGVG